MLGQLGAHPVGAPALHPQRPLQPRREVRPHGRREQPRGRARRRVGRAQRDGVDHLGLGAPRRRQQHHGVAALAQPHRGLRARRRRRAAPRPEHRLDPREQLVEGHAPHGEEHGARRDVARLHEAPQPVAAELGDLLGAAANAAAVERSVVEDGLGQQLREALLAAALHGLVAGAVTGAREGAEALVEATQPRGEVAHEDPDVLRVGVARDEGHRAGDAPTPRGRAAHLGRAHAVPHARGHHLRRQRGEPRTVALGVVAAAEVHEAHEHRRRLGPLDDDHPEAVREARRAHAPRGLGEQRAERGGRVAKGRIGRARRPPRRAAAAREGQRKDPPRRPHRDLTDSTMPDSGVDASPRSITTTRRSSGSHRSTAARTASGVTAA